MRETLRTLPVPNVDGDEVRHWFGDVKGFEAIDLLVQIVTKGAPVDVAGQGDLQAALQYGNHRSVARFEIEILEKIKQDLLLGRAFVFPREAAAQIPGLRISPLTVAVSATKNRICHDLSNAASGKGVNEDTNTSALPEYKIGHVLRDVIWRILYLYGCLIHGVSGDTPRIMLAKQDFKSAFRQIYVECSKSPSFGYVWGTNVIIDQCLQFGWTSSPALWGVGAAAVEKAHNNTTIDSAVITPEGRAATSHVRVEPPKLGERQVRLPPDCQFPRDEGVGMHDPFCNRTFVDDALFVEPEIDGGKRCIIASQSYASDCYRALGSRASGEPPLLSRDKITSWDTRMEMLGWVIDTQAMTISVPQDKIAKLRGLLQEWPVDRKTASVKDIQSLLGKLLHVSEVVRCGRFFIRRVLNQLGLAPLTAGVGSSQSHALGARQNQRVVRLSREFHADIAFWTLILDMSTGPDGVTRLESPLFCRFLQPPSRILVSDASGDSMGGYCLESGKWWRIDFTEDVRARLRKKVQSRDDLSMNVFELLGMVMTAWALTVHAGAMPEYPGQSVLMRGDNQSACHWVTRARGAREPRSGALMRMLGCLEIRNGWQFRAKHIKGLQNTLADGISRWKHDEIAHNLHSYRPDICWQEQRLGQEAEDITSAVLASSSSDEQLRDRLKTLTRQVAGLGSRFVG